MIQTYLSQWRWWLGPLTLFVLAVPLVIIARAEHNAPIAGFAGFMLATAFWRGYADLSRRVADYYRDELVRLEAILEECNCGDDEEDEDDES